MTEISNVLQRDLNQSAGGPGKSDSLSLEFFEIPLNRQVQGNAFPLGLKVSDNSGSANLEYVLKHIEELAGRGLFRELLQTRKSPYAGRETTIR